MSLVTSIAFDSAQGNALRANATQLAGAKLWLFKNNVYPGKDALITDFIRPTTGGLVTSKTVTPAAPVTNDVGKSELWSLLQQFTTTDLVDLPCTIYGYVMEASSGGALLFAERFATPYTFNRVGQVFRMVLRFTIG